MTRERAGHLALVHILLPGVDMNTAIINAIMAACEEEREACAKIADDYCLESQAQSRLTAAAIRNRGKDQT